MIALALTVILFLDTRIVEHVNISQSYTDTLPNENRSKQALKQKSFTESKVYCCNYCEAKYEIINRSNKLTIIYIYKDRRNTIHGIIKNGKIYSDDPEENIYKSQAGEIYRLKNNAFIVKHIENGEYDYYALCK